MKDFIKQMLREAVINMPDTTHKQELKTLQHQSLSDPSRKLNINDIHYRMAKAAEVANTFKKTNPEDNYFSIPSEGDGFYQVEFRHDGQIKTKHVRPSADMTQQGGRFQPTDVGTCKDFQAIARYCFVKAGKGGRSVGASPAEDAANKALIIFKSEILGFLGDSHVDPEQAAQISKEKMNDKQAQHKEKKDLETELGFRITDAQWQTYLNTGQKPKGKEGVTMDPAKAAEQEKRQAEIKARIEKARTRMGK